MFNKVKQFVDDSFKEIVPHFERTVYWLKELKPDADEAMEIAAYAHDIARAFRSADSIKKFKDKELNDPMRIKEHQEEGVKIIGKFLRDNHYNEKDTLKVENMVLKHEVGGNEESNFIKDADSISYLEINAPKHIEKWVPNLGKEKVRRKFQWMFDRITSNKAKELAKPFYIKAIELLEKA